MKVVDDTTELIVGKMYDVKCAVVMNSNTFIGHVPIIGDKHKDPQFGVNFHHYHIDGRFFNKNKAVRVDRDGKTNSILQTNEDGYRNHVSEVVIKRRKCIRLTTGINPPAVSRNERYDNWYKSMVGKSCAGKKCPHLGTAMKEENGKLVCPLHGLKGCIESKEEIEPAVHLFERYVPITVANELKNDFDHALMMHFSATSTDWNMTSFSLANGYYKLKRIKD